MSEGPRSKIGFRKIWNFLVLEVSDKIPLSIILVFLICDIFIELASTVVLSLIYLNLHSFQARGVLLLIGNADWAARRANSHTFSAYASAGFANVDDLRSRVISAWNSATDKLIDLYVHIRSTWLCCPLAKEATPDIGMLCYLSDVSS